MMSAGMAFYARCPAMRARFLSCGRVLHAMGEPMLPPRVEDRLFRQRLAEEGSAHKASAAMAASNRRMRPQVELTQEQRAIVAAIRQCTQDLDWQGALALYRQLPPDAGEDWLPAYRAVLHCCCKALRYDESKMVFDNLPARDILSYNSMLNLLGRLRLSDEVDQLLQRMENEGIRHTGATYCQVMTGHAESHRWSEALSLLETLKSDAELHETTNWEVAYLTSMTACARAGEQEKVRALMEELRSSGKGEVRNTHYNALIISCGADGQKADAVFQELQDAGLTPRAPDWRAYLTCHRDCKEQQQVYARMRQEIPSARPEEAWAILLRTAANNEDFESAEWVVEEMRKHNCELDSQQAQSVPALRRAISIYRTRQRQVELLALTGSQGAERRMPPMPPTPSSALPEGWQSAQDPASGNFYYWHIDDPSGTTTWERP